MGKNFIRPSAIISDNAFLGSNIKIWDYVQIREAAVIGNNCILGKNVYIDSHVVIGSNCKIQNNVSIYQGVIIEDGVFIGPHVCFTNDKYPRAINFDGTLKQATDWDVSTTKICYGASIGANATISPGLTIGKFAMIGAGSVVTKNIPDFQLVVGNPARKIGVVNEKGEVVSRIKS